MSTFRAFAATGRPARALPFCPLLSRGDTGANPRCVVAQFLRAVIPDVFPAIGRGITAGSRPPAFAVGLGANKPAGVLAAACLLVESLFRYAEGVNRRRHPAVEHHLRDYFRDFLFGNANMQRAGDVPLDHLGAVTQHHQGGDSAEAAGFEIDGGAIVNFAIDHPIHQPHHLGGELGHRGRGLRVVLRPIVAHPEVGRGLFQVYDLFIVILEVQFVLRGRLIGPQIQVILVVFSVQSIHLGKGSLAPG